MKRYIYPILATALLAALSSCGPQAEKSTNTIDRKTLVGRHNPHVTSIDSLASLTIGNGGFAFTADVTGLQTFSTEYAAGVPLGTQADWGWHRFPNVENLKIENAIDKDGYAVQTGKGIKPETVDYFRANAHRLHLGLIGFEQITPDAVSGIDQTLDMYNGVLSSRFSYNGKDIAVTTSVDPEKDMVVATISSEENIPVKLRIPYPTGDEFCTGYEVGNGHGFATDLRSTGTSNVILVKMNSTRYFIKADLRGAYMRQNKANEYIMVPTDKDWGFTLAFSPAAVEPAEEDLIDASRTATAKYWNEFWEKGGAVDFSACTDPRAAELERRVVLSQYLTAVQCAGVTPAQDAGLVYNSNYGKFNLETLWWQEAQFALWGHPELLANTLEWYRTSYRNAVATAGRQGYEGARWMSLTDVSGVETPSDTGSRIAWQQPHIIYLAELLKRAGKDVSSFAEIIDGTSSFMRNFAVYDEDSDSFSITCLPAQECLPANSSKPVFETAYWQYALGIAGCTNWLSIGTANKMAAPVIDADGRYMAAANVKDTYTNPKYRTGHPSILAAYGMLPATNSIDKEAMGKTLDWVLGNWNWETACGWDFPMTAMNATRLGEPAKAIDALMMENGKNTYLANGHNMQDENLRCYLPGNGSLLSAIALMCAGWDGCEVENPGFPKDGTWNVRWEGIKPLP